MSGPTAEQIDDTTTIWTIEHGSANVLQMGHDGVLNASRQNSLDHFDTLPWRPEHETIISIRKYMWPGTIGQAAYMTQDLDLLPFCRHET